MCLHPNIALPEEHFARPFVLQMIETNPKKRISLRGVIDQLTPLQPPNRLSLLQCDSKNWLCSTGTLSLVYRVGTFEGSPLAVKRVARENCTTKSFKELRQLDHPNIVSFLYFDEDDLYK
jgi:serine/threonine protein kinase